MDPTTHYLWEPPAEQSDWSVALSFEVIDGILQEVLRAFGAVPKRGAETGGLLLGRVVGQQVQIEAFELVPCDYRLGPSYVFPPDDWTRWEEALGRRASEPLRPVGFFRSDTRDELTLAAEDIQLLDRFLPGNSTAVLIIRPFATKVSQAGFYFRRGGAFPAQSPLTFPFSRKALGGGRRRDAGGAEPASGEAETHLLPAESSAADAPRLARSVPALGAASQGVWVAAITLSVALGWSGGFFLARHSPRPPDPNQFRLGLQVVARGSDVQIRWDTGAEPIRTATRGQLRVREASGERSIALDLELLRQGLVVYQSPPGPVHFELEVEQLAGSVLRESTDYRPR